MLYWQRRGWLVFRKYGSKLQVWWGHYSFMLPAQSCRCSQNDTANWLCVHKNQTCQPTWPASHFLFFKLWNVPPSFYCGFSACCETFPLPSGKRSLVRLAGESHLSRPHSQWKHHCISHLCYRFWLLQGLLARLNAQWILRLCPWQSRLWTVDDVVMWPRPRRLATSGWDLPFSDKLKSPPCSQVVSWIFPPYFAVNMCAYVSVCV